MLEHQNQQQLTPLWQQVNQLQTQLSSVHPEVHTKCKQQAPDAIPLPHGVLLAPKQFSNIMAWHPSWQQETAVAKKAVHLVK